MAERMTLCNMSAELGAQAGLVAPDDTTRDWLAETGGARGRHRTLAQRRPRARRAPRLRRVVAGAPGGGAAQPGQRACRRWPRADTRIDVAYIGACTGAKLDDLRFAAAGAGWRTSPPACSCWWPRPA
jgi:3-isopropylmalate/(R)-2-methylmalate dehydratase large subunit